jgi:peptidoglycan/LPS O-acetylase OafA/YrhL
MGFLRLLLALGVVINHSAPVFGLTMTQGRLSVQLFYIISGFYMSLVLNEKYPRGSYWVFISNRYLRLYPVYLAILCLTLVACMLSGWILNDWQRLIVWNADFRMLAFPAKAWIVLSNMFIGGLDSLMFFSQNKLGGVSFSPSVVTADNHIPLLNYILVPQAWTLGVELAFYAVAPFLVRRSSYVIFGFALLSLSLRLYFYEFAGLCHDPWTYRFFPFELALFLMGSLSYKIYLVVKDHRLSNRVALVGGGMFFVACIFFPEITKNLNPDYCVMAYWSACMLIIPFLFNRSKNSKLDEYVGEYSYPVYLIHVVIAGGVSVLLTRWGLSRWLGEMSILLSLLASSLVIHFISLPLDAFRKKRFVKKFACAK